MEARDSQAAGEPSQSEKDLTDARREYCGLDSRPERPWALAFSGGGIRSATFCLGVARALANNGVFKRFDYLSTVSGGGYIGSAIGRLFSPKTDAQRVNDGLKDDQSLFLWWLRSNGRFLLPAGFGDIMNAWSSYIRGLVATHLEVGFLCALLSCLVILPHLLMLGDDRALEIGAAMFNPWWVAVPTVAGIGTLAIIYAYWVTRDSSETASRAIDATLSILAGLLAWWFVCGDPAGNWSSPRQIAGAICASMPLGYLLHVVGRFQRRKGIGASASWERVPARHARVRMTHWYSTLLMLSLGLLVLGVLDFLSWTAASQLSAQTADIYFGTIGATGFAILLLRAVIPALQKNVAQKGGQLPLAQIANAVGLAITLLVIVLWMIAAQWFVYFFDSLGNFLLSQKEFPSALQAFLDDVGPTYSRWLLLSGFVAVYMFATGHNAAQPNRSSLHQFYRSRLARTYVSTGNSPDHNVAPKHLRFSTSPLTPTDLSNTTSIGKINEFWDGDDVALGDYRPHERGGPIHLIGCCINQTVDDRTGGYNADRKGVSLTVSSLGVELGTRDPVPDLDLNRSGLAQWIAISGAAVGPGMGSASRFGLSALSFLTGVRLGYWWSRPGQPLYRRLFDKYLSTLEEWFGKFPGLGSSRVYVSDGGHFDNTGVYTLLKRKPEFILAADCGADPRYVFADLENLVRKARIDYKAKIEFLSVAGLRNDPDLKPFVPLFGTPDSLTPEPRQAFLLLARITYHDGSRGRLLVIKPKRIRRLPLDVAGYSDRDTLFPQQGTGDQFFDESQWESYCDLGRRLGDAVSTGLLDVLPTLEAGGVVVETRSLSSEPDDEDSGSRRQRSSVVRNTLGLGAIASVIIASWQVWKDVQETQRTDLVERLDTISKTTDEKRLQELLQSSDAALDQNLKKVVDSIENVGLLFGPDAQNAAQLKVVDAVTLWCDHARKAEPAPLTQSNGEQSPKELAAITEKAKQALACPVALAALSTPRVSRWVIAFDDYWDSTLLKPVESKCSKELSARYFVIHTPVAGASVSEISKLARAQGMRVRTIPYDEGNPVGLTQSIVIHQKKDLECANELVDKLDTNAPKQQVLSSPVHGFGYAASEIHLWVAPEARPPTPAKNDPQPTNASVFSIVTGNADLPPMALGQTIAPIKVKGEPDDVLSKKTNYRVYIQFRGDFSREQINSYRVAVALSEADPKHPKISKYSYTVPPAERLAGEYNSHVKYFRTEEKEAAEALVVKTKDAFKAANCKTGDPELEAVQATGSPPPNTLEVWLNLEKCDGFKPKSKAAV